MTDDEAEAVAVELAKAGGVSWHSGQERRHGSDTRDRRPQDQNLAQSHSSQGKAVFGL
jgi:hypothetical protein